MRVDSDCKLILSLQSSSATDHYCTDGSKFSSLVSLRGNFPLEHMCLGGHKTQLQSALEKLFLWTIWPPVDTKLSLLSPQ